MARTAIPVQTSAAFGGKIQNLTYTNGDSVNGHEFVHPGGDVLLIVKNDDASSHDAVLKGVASRLTFNRVADVTITAAATSISVCSVPDKGFDQGSQLVYIDLAVATSMKFAIIKQTATN